MNGQVELRLENETVWLTQKLMAELFQVGKLLWQFGNKPVDGKSLMAAVGISYRPTFLYSYLQPALNVGLVEMTIPDKLRSSKQKYRFTDKGKEWVERNQA